MKNPDQDLALSILLTTNWLTPYSAAMSENLVKEGRFIRLIEDEWAQSEGDERSGLFIVISGLLHTYYAPLGDRVLMVGFTGAGSVLGHATRYSGGPRLVTAVCAEPTIILEITETALDRVAANHPEIWRAIAGFTYSNMQSILRLAAEIICLPPRARIASRLLAISQIGGRQAQNSIKLSQEMLAEMIGVTRKTVNQHLSALEKHGYITVGYGRVTINNISALKALASGKSSAKR